MTPRNLEGRRLPTFTSPGHTLTLLPKTQGLFVTWQTFSLVFGVSGTPGLGPPTLSFTISLHFFMLQLQGASDLFTTLHPQAHQCFCSCCFLWLEKLNTQAPSIETYPLSAECFSLLLCVENCSFQSSLCFNHLLASLSHQTEFPEACPSLTHPSTLTTSNL